MSLLVRRNIPDFASDDYLSLCRFNPYDPHDRYCPIFLLDTIVQSAGYAFDDVTKEVHIFTKVWLRKQEAVCGQNQPDGRLV